MIRKIYTKQESFKNVSFLILFTLIWYTTLLSSLLNRTSSSNLSLLIFLLAGLLPFITAVQNIKQTLYYRKLHRECMKQRPQRGRITGCTCSSYQQRGSRGRTHTYYEYFLMVEVYDAQTLIPTTIKSEAYSWPVYKVLASPEVDVYTDESGWHYVIDGFRYKKSRREPDILDECAFDRAPVQSTQRVFSVLIVVIMVLMIFRSFLKL